MDKEKFNLEMFSRKKIRNEKGIMEGGGGSLKDNRWAFRVERIMIKRGRENLKGK